MELKYQITGLDCANCARKIEKITNKMKNVETAEVRFVQNQLVMQVTNDFGAKDLKKLQNKITKISDAELIVED